MLDPRTYVYIDGFNVYYRLLERNPAVKWLNLEAWSGYLLPSCQVDRIRYFTALVKARPNDPNKPNRQQLYLRALRTLPLVSIHLGRYRTRERRMWLKSPTPGGPNTVEVIYEEEKGTDVNLASHLLMDGFSGAYELAVVISDDSDLKLPIEMVINQIESASLGAESTARAGFGLADRRDSIQGAAVWSASRQPISNQPERFCGRF